MTGYINGPCAADCRGISARRAQTNPNFSRNVGALPAGRLPGLAAPARVRRVDVRSAAEMHDAVLRELGKSLEDIAHLRQNGIV